MNRSITLIVPAYNEQETLYFSVTDAVKKLRQRGFDYEILIFNDASTDRTGAIATVLSVVDPRIKVFHNDKNMNLGFNFSRGIQLAAKTYCGLWPSHNLTDAESLDLILPALEKYDVVVAYIGNPEVRPWTRRIISEFNVILINLIFGLRLKYYHLNFFRTEILKKIPVSTKSYALMVETLVYAVKSGASYVQVPTLLRKRKFGKSKALRLKNIINILKTYIYLFWQIGILRKRINWK